MTHFAELLQAYDLDNHKAQLEKCNKRRVGVTENDDPFEMVKTVLAGQLGYAQTQDDAVRILFALACGTITAQLMSQLKQPAGDDETWALLLVPANAHPL
jgi:hypothetical protein